MSPIDGKRNPVGDAWGKPLDGGSEHSGCGCPWPFLLALLVLILAVTR